MKIAVIGAGNVGSTLGKRWVEEGHEVIFGVRDPQAQKIKSLLDETNHKAVAVAVAEAVDSCETIVFAAPWPAAEEIIASVDNWEGKVLIDCTNPLTRDLSGLEIGHTTSAAEEIARWAKGAKVVKAFNTTGSKNMADPVVGGEKTTMFIAGDDSQAKNTATQLAEEIGFDVIDCGNLHAARYLESLAMLWIHLAFVQGYGTDISMKILKR